MKYTPHCYYSIRDPLSHTYCYYYLLLVDCFYCCYILILIIASFHCFSIQMAMGSEDDKIAMLKHASYARFWSSWMMRGLIMVVWNGILKKWRAI